MSALPSISSHQHWFLHLDEGGKKEVLAKITQEQENRTLLTQKYPDSKSRYAKALAWLTWDVRHQGTEPEKDQNIDQVVKLLNDAALDKVPNNNPAKGVFKWKQHVKNLTGFVSRLNTCAFWSTAGAVGAVGMGVLYRSHKVLLVANLCVVCALWFFRSTALTLATAGESLKAVIEQLNIDNLKDIDTNLNVNAVYEGLEKTSYLMRLYLPHQRKTISGDRPSQELFDKQLFALTQIRSTAQRCQKGSNPLQQKDANIDSIKAFFQNFEKICSKGTLISVGFTVLGAALTYHAYMRKAHLMILAGIIHCVVSSQMSWHFFRLQRGAKKIYTASDIAKAFNEVVPTSRLLSAMRMQNATAYDIEQIVVIPFDAILTLVPGWKTPVN